MTKPAGTVRINKYLADKGFCTRREADQWIKEGRIKINGRLAELGSQVSKDDTVQVSGKNKSCQYYAFYKPREVITHSPEAGEGEIADFFPDGFFPVGRLDKDSEGLIIVTNDGRITDRLLNPDKEHIELLLEGLLENEKKHRLKLCPCRLRDGTRERDLELICPCNFKTHETWLKPKKGMLSMCICGLFVKRQ